MLEDIKTISIPGISEATGAYLCEGCVVCMNRQSHSSGVQLSLKGDKTASIPTEWSMAYTDQLDRSWQDQEYTPVLSGVKLLSVRTMSLV